MPRLSSIENPTGIEWMTWRSSALAHAIAAIQHLPHVAVADLAAAEVDLRLDDARGGKAAGQVDDDPLDRLAGHFLGGMDGVADRMRRRRRDRRSCRCGRRARSGGRCRGRAARRLDPRDEAADLVVPISIAAIRLPRGRPAPKAGRRLAPAVAVGLDARTLAHADFPAPCVLPGGRRFWRRFGVRVDRAAPAGRAAADRRSARRASTRWLVRRVRRAGSRRSGILLRAAARRSHHRYASSSGGRRPAPPP